MSSISVSVIIPALNEEAYIGQAIQSAWVAGATEVIVADGGSNDRTLDIARRMGAQDVCCPTGRAIQQNAGAAVAINRELETRISTRVSWAGIG